MRKMLFLTLMTCLSVVSSGELNAQKIRSDFTIRYYTGFHTHGPMITGGLKLDQKHTLGVFFVQGDTYKDSAPADLYKIGGGLHYRFNPGNHKAVSFYSDFMLGADWIYKIGGNAEGIEEEDGDIGPVIGWQPGIKFRIYNKLNLFLGPTLATNCIGLHLGIGF